jgi:hypothetical protein
MGYDVSVAVEPRRPMAAVAATTTWEQFPAQLQTRVVYPLQQARPGDA